MAGGDVAKPKCCKICGKLSCQGDCKSCARRQAGECKELYIPYTYRDKDNNIVYYFACVDCSLPFRKLNIITS